MTISAVIFDLYFACGKSFRFASGSAAYPPGLMVTTIMTERWGVPELNRRTHLDAGVRERQRDVAGLSRGFAGAVPLSWITPLMAMPPGTVFGLILIATGGSMRSASERVAPPVEPFIPTFVTAVRSTVCTWK